MPFVKLFSSITESTIWCEDDQTRIVWITLLAIADRKGFVSGSIPGLANRARVPIEATRKAIAKFLAPDPDSGTKDHDGRRVEQVDGGWRLINYEKYRAIRDDDERREYMKGYMRDRRSQGTSVNNPVNFVNSSKQCKPELAKAEAEAEADVEAEKDKTFSLDSEQPPPKVDPRHTPFKEKLKKFWAHLNDGKELYWTPADAKQLKNFLKEFPSITLDQFHDILSNYKHSEGIVTSKTPKQFIPSLNLYMNGSLNKFKQPLEDGK